MKTKLLISSLLLVLPLILMAEDKQSQATRIAQEAIIIDTHIDVPYRLQENYEDVTRATESGDFDYPRAVKGGLNVPFMSIYTPAEMEAEGGSWLLANQLIDGMEALVGRAPDHFAIAHSIADVKQAVAANKLAMVMGMENGSPLEGDLKNIDYFYQRGVRYITLAHGLSNHISDSSYDDNRQWQGLSPFGKEVVKAMNNAGIMIDVSHVSDQAFYQVLELSEVPVLASHSSARHFTPGWERNMSDDMIKALAAKGGVIQVNFGSSFITQTAKAWYDRFDEARTAWLEEQALGEDSDEAGAYQDTYRESHPYPFATTEQVVDHFDHVIALVGVDYVGIGSDYDGVGNSLPIGLKDVASYPALIQEFLNRDYSREDIEKILGGNLLRVWKATEVYAEAHH